MKRKKPLWVREPVPAKRAKKTKRAKAPVPRVRKTINEHVWFAGKLYEEN